MAEKVCPFMSSPEKRQVCLEEQCMMYVEGSTKMDCVFPKTLRSVKTRIDTLTAQMQEIQVILNVMTNDTKG